MCPRASKDEEAERQGVVLFLDLFESSPSEHTKTATINKKLIPWIEKNGMYSLFDKFRVPSLYNFFPLYTHIDTAFEFG
jgi:hypothetical protein